MNNNIIETSPTYFTTPLGEEMVVLSRVDYERLTQVVSEEHIRDALDYLISLEQEDDAPAFSLHDLRSVRLAQALTQKQLSDMSGFSQATISALESGRMQGSIDTWLQLSKVLGVQFGLIHSR